MSIQESLNNTAPIDFQYKERTSELELLRNEYQALLENNQRLEEEVSLKQSTIESMKLALNYNSTYQITRESDYKIRIEELEKTLKASRKEKESLSTTLTKQIVHKDSYIENLLTTMLNLHQKIEYYKEDVTNLRKDFDSQKKHLEIEALLREKTEKLYQDSLKELDTYKKSYIELKHKAVETDIDSEEIFKNLKSEYEHEYVEETQKLAKNYEVRMKEMSDEYSYRIENVDKANKEVVSNLLSYTQNKIDSIKVHYEQRIFKMIKEYSFQEAKVQSKMANLSHTITNLEDKYASLLSNSTEKSLALEIITKERKNLKSQKQELEKYLLSLEIENKVIISNTLSDLEHTKKKLEIQQKDLQHEFDHKLKLLHTHNSIKTEGIKARYERKLQKLLKNSEENSEKLQKFHEKQCQYLLEALSKLESEKTNLNIQLEHNVRELKNELDYTITTYEKKLSMSKEAILKDFETEKAQLINEYKLQIHEQNKEFAIERKKIEETVENAYKKILLNAKAQSDREKLELFQDNLKKMEQVQNLAQKKTDHLENQLSIVKKSFYEEGEKWNKIIDNKEQLIKKLEKQIEELSLELDREKVKVLSTLHDQGELDNFYKAKIQEVVEEYREKELKMLHRFENERKSWVSKASGDKMELEIKFEKTVRVLNEKIDSLTHRYKMLEKKKKDIFLKENQQTVQRYVNEITDRNKTIDKLNKEIGKLKVQIKYVGDTVKIFTDDRILAHRKMSSEIPPGTIRRPSSSGANKTFKF